MAIHIEKVLQAALREGASDVILTAETQALLVINGKVRRLGEVALPNEDTHRLTYGLLT